jgi:predicted amino acid racemase/arginase family enzyme
MAGPKVTIDLSIIERNARTVVQRCAAEGIGVFGVTKGTCGMPQVARAMLRGGVRGIAESRFENIHRLREAGIDCPIMLLRSPPLGRAEDVVRNVDVSLQSELATMREISRVAERLGRVHDIILMVDLGDLREGIWPSDLLATVEQVMELKGIRIAGIGTNLTCFGAIVPTEDNLNQLIGHAYKVERLTGSHLDFVSGGNSSSLPLLLAGRMPKGVNNLRIGEAILQGGRDTFLEEPWSDLEGGAFTLAGELLEVKVKPSMPIGKSGVDAFGQRPRFIDEGDRLRGIANIGREDVIVEGLTPTNAGVRVLGASSDHLVLDLTEAPVPLNVGDVLGFQMNYGAMLTVMTSEYVEKVPMLDVVEAPKRRLASLAVEEGAAKSIDPSALASQLEAIGYEVVPAGEAHVVALHFGSGRETALQALREVARSDALGLIWIDARAALGDGEALRRILADLKPAVAAENVVIVALREASPEEASFIRSSRLTVFTMVDIDARGMRDVMREAVKIARAGTLGYHVAYAPEATDMRGWDDGTGGLTVRETHQAMEAIATSGGLVSLSVSSISDALPPGVAATAVHAVLSALGKQIY